MAQKSETNWESIQKVRTQNRLDDILLRCKGAIGVDVDYKEVQGKKTDRLGITVYVKRKLQNMAVDVAVPKEIQGIPTDVVECPNVWPQEKEKQPTTKSEYTNTWPHEPNMSMSIEGTQFQPAAAESATTSFACKSLAGGSRIRNTQQLLYYGTLGIILYDKVNNVLTGLSCAHVMQTGQDVIFEEETMNPVGTVSRHYFGNENVDAAVLPIHNDRLILGYVDQIGIIQQYARPTLNQEVTKMGATSGLTHGRVYSTTLTWKYTDPILGEVPTLYDQIVIVPLVEKGPLVENGQQDFAKRGDSGSAVIASCDGKLSMVGMIVSGDPDKKFIICNNAYDIQQCFPELQFHK